MESQQILRQQIAMMKQTFFDEGFLSAPQLQQLEELQDRDNPHFVQEIFALFFRDTIRQFNDIDKNLYKEQGAEKEDTDRLIHRLKGSVLSLGALKMLDEVNKMMQFWEEDDLDRTIATFEQVKIEQKNLKAKVEPYFQLLRQLGPSETAQRPK